VASANLDLVRSINADWERGDFSGTHWADTEIEFEFRDGPARGKWTGVAGMAEGWLAWLGAWADFRAEADEYRRSTMSTCSCSATSAGAAGRAGSTSGRSRRRRRACSVSATAR